MSSRVTVVAAVPGGVGDRGAGGDDVGAHAVDLERRADLGDLEQRRVGRARPRRRSSWAARIRSVSARSASAYARGEAVRVGVVGHPAAHHLDPQRRVARRGDLDGQPEPVEQLRPELALLGVHRADQHEAGGVLDRDAVPLDGRAAHRGGVEQQVDEVVVQQVDLVDVEDPAVRARRAGRARTPPCPRPAPARGAASRAPGPRWRRRAARPGGPAGSRSRRPPANGPSGRERRRVARGRRRTGRRRPLDRRQHGGQRPDDRGLRGALLAADQHAADVGRDGGEDQGQRHAIGRRSRRRH